MSGRGVWYGLVRVDKPFQMIETADALLEMAARLRDEPCVALDTEFVWDRTYYARLGLIQVALADGTCFLVDPITLPMPSASRSWSRRFGRRSAHG